MTTSLNPPIIPTFVFHCNGIYNTSDEVDDFLTVQQRVTGIFGIKHYNGSAAPEKMKGLIIKGSVGLLTSITGAASAVVAVASSVLAPPLGVAYGALALATSAFTGKIVGKDIDNIQINKEKIARNLAKRVSCILKQYPTAIVTLVGHSQGAHVVDLALSKLSRWKDRISAIGIGGLVSICQHKAARVANIVNEGDTIARGWADTYRKNMLKFKTKSLCKHNFHPAHSSSQTKGLKHEALDYLRNKEYLNTLKHFFSTTAPSYKV